MIFITQQYYKDPIQGLLHILANGDTILESVQRNWFAPSDTLGKCPTNGFPHF